MTEEPQDDYQDWLDAMGPIEPPAWLWRVEMAAVVLSCLALAFWLGRAGVPLP